MEAERGVGCVGGGAADADGEDAERRGVRGSVRVLV